MCRTEDFQELTVNDVEDLISCDNIYVQTEDTVIEAIQFWCSRDQAAREQHTQRLIQHVKLSNLSSDSINTLVQNNLISSSHLDETVTVKSRSRGLNKFIVAMAFDSNAVEYLDLDRVEEGWNILTECPNMRYGLSGAGLVSMGDTLLVTGDRLLSLTWSATDI